jgi:hypothetical protein
VHQHHHGHERVSQYYVDCIHNTQHHGVIVTAPDATTARAEALLVIVGVRGWARATTGYVRRVG